MVKTATKKKPAKKAKKKHTSPDAAFETEVKEVLTNALGDSAVLVDNPLGATSAEPERDEAESEPEPESESDQLAKLKGKFHRIEELNKEIDSAARQMQDDKEALKESKALYDALVLRLRTEIKRANDPQQQFDFGANGEAPKNDDAWKAVTLEELGITGKNAEKLTEAGLTTLGKISEYTAAEKLLTDIEGIGNATAEKIAATCADWWSRHPQPEAAIEGDAVEAGEASEGDKTEDAE